MHPENINNTLHSTDSKHYAGNTLTTAIFYLAIFIFIVALAFPHNPAGNWYQQFLPNISGATIRDITFTDSLTGYAVANLGFSNNNYILKTSNGGDNWTVKLTITDPFQRIQFIDASTGFTNAYQKIYKTTNAGENWTPINLPSIFGDDMFVLSNDTIWLAMSESLTGGVYRTTNGGASWTQQLFLGSQNPNHVYFFNGRLGFIGEDNVYLRRTSDGGANWSLISGTGGFTDMHFTDTLTGWKTSFQKTTNGGLNWVNQQLPQGGNILISQIVKFDNINFDTIIGVGSTVITGSGNRAAILRTTNSGNIWLFQVPDSTINIFQYQHVQFTGRYNGWAYSGITGVHTTNGGDPVWYTGIEQISSNVPDNFKLYQNYPNPFNPKTNIKYEVFGSSEVLISVFDITGRHIVNLVNSKHQAGTYEVDFSASGYSSGVYFYTLFINQKIIDTKKMILIK